MWTNPQETSDLVTFTEEILNGKLHFLRSVWKWDDSFFLSLNLFNVDIYKGTNSFIYIYICC